MAYDYEYCKKKAKKKDEEEYQKIVSSNRNTISTKTTPNVNLEDDDRKWFQKGLFEDGWQAGDLLKTIKASLADVGGNAGTGVIGMGETIADTLASIGTILGGQQMNQNAQNELIHNVVTGKNTEKNAEDVIKKYDNWQKEAKKGTEEFIKQDLYDEKAIANKIITAPLEEKWDVNAETDSVFGEKSDSLVQSAGQLGATALLSATGIPWWLTSGLTSFGGEAENALNQGATLEEATVSGLISAGAEILTEKISGGIKFGGKTLDDALTKTLAKNVSNKVARTLAKFGMDAVGEGAEEVLSGVMSAVGQKLTYADDKELNELFSSEDAWESFIGGAVLGGFSSAGNAVKSSVTGVDALSGLTTNEKAVFDKVYKDTIAEREKGGEKLTAKEKTKIYDDVLNKLEKGYISTDTIESVLGGETYKQYQTEVDNEKALQDEFNTLNKMKQGEMTGEQLDRRNELKEQLKAIKEGTTISDLKSKLSTEVSELAKNSRLAESYNEKSRKSQAFEADLSKYDEKQQSAVKRAIDSGILNNSNRTHEFVDLIAKLEADKGVLFDFTNNEKLKGSMFTIEGKEVAGYVQGNNIAINIDSSKALNTVVGHEITHILEGTELYPALQDAVKVFAESKGEYNSKLQSITEMYDGMEGANIENELTAELVGEYLFSDTEFIKNLSAEQPGVFKKIYEEIKYLCKVATTGSKELRQLEKVKKTFAEVYRQKNNTVTDNGVKYNIEYSNYEANNNLLKFIERVKEGKTNSNDKFYFNTVTDENAKIIFDLTGIDVRGFKIAIEARQVEHILKDHGEKSESDKSMSNDFDIARMEYTISHPDEITNSGRTQAYTHMKNGKNRTAPTVLLEKSIGDKSYYVVEAIADTKAKTVYIVTAFIGEKGYKKETSQLTDTKSPSATAERGSASISKNIISNPTENVKEVFGYKINQDADVNEDLLEDMSYYHPDAEVDTQGNITVYHRTTKANAEKIKQTGVMTAKEDALFFSSKENGYASDYGDTVVKMKIPSTELRLNDVFDGEVHFDLPLKYKNGGYSLDVSKYIVDETKFSLVDGSTDIAPEMNNNIYGEDIKLEIDDVPIKETTSAEVTENNTIEIPDITVDDMEFTVLDDSDSSAESNDNSNEKSNDFFDEKAVTRLSSKVINELGVAKTKGNRTAIKELIKDFGGNLSTMSKEDLYTAVSEKFGTQYIEELNNEIIESRSYLKEVKINVTDSVKSEFGDSKDYASFVKQNFGKLWISKDGVGIDQVYANLNEMYPHLFPDDVWNEANQLRQISNVINRPKSDLIQMELDTELLQNATDLIYDSVNEYHDVMGKVNNVTDNIEAADISEKVKRQIEDELFSAFEKIEADFNIEKNSLVNKLNERRKNLETSTADKNTFLKNSSKELYDELKGLRKGVRASEDLAYFLDLGFNWNELKSTFLKVNKWPDTVLNSESEIETTVRDFLDQKYDDSVQELNDFDFVVGEELNTLEEKAEEKRYNAKLAVNGKLVREIMDAEQVSMMGDTSLWKDKSKGFMYKTETEKRNFFDIVRDNNGKKDTKKAQALYDYFMGTYNHNEAQLKREASVIQKKFADLKLNKYEDVFVQMKGEFLHNPHTELTQHDIDTFMKLHGEKINEGKVDNAIDMARETYDSLIERMNEVLVAHGMKPIEYRKGYFPHFSEVEKTKFQKIAEKFLNWKTRNDDIPTDIAGMTESFKPNRSWQSFNKQRVGDETDYSFMKGFDGYLQGSLDWIYHIDDIMKRRVFENRIRYDHSDEGVKKQIQEIYKNNEFDTNAKQEQIDLVFREAENPLNNFIIDFRTRTNTLAGKKSSMDRGMEEFTSRKFYSTMTNISNRVTGNMVAGSVSSALTNFIPITQSWGEVSPVNSLRAMGETIKSTFKDDGTINKSDFLTNRLNNVEKLYQTGWDKANKVAGSLMEAIDSFTSQTVWRSKYIENMSKGMSEAEAIKNADEFAENLIAGRSRGNMPTIFDSKNPLIKAVTAFQLEVNNQYRYMFKDMPQNLKDESVAKLVKGYATMFIGAYAYNAAYSALTGRDAAFDPIRIIQELIGDLSDDEEDKPADIIMDLTDNVLEELPFVGGLFGGGRIPISSALPYGDGIYEAIEGTLTDLTEGDLENLTKEWLFSAGAYVLSPTAGGQIKKTIQGLSMFDDDRPVAGSYTDSGKLRFTVDETMGEMIKAGLFGQYSSKNAQQYFDEERTPLSDKKTQELVDLDIPIEQYWEYQDGLKALGTDASLQEKVDYIANLTGYSTEQKNIMANNLTDRKIPIDLTDYDKYESLDALDYASENPEKYLIAKAVGGYDSYKTYSDDLYDIKADKDKNGKSISGSKKKKVTAYINDLDIDYGAKLILFKSQYKSDDRYNSEIVDYLNSREDITRDEIITILKELDFTVYDDGTVRW